MRKMHLLSLSFSLIGPIIFIVYVLLLNCSFTGLKNVPGIIPTLSKLIGSVHPDLISTLFLILPVLGFICGILSLFIKNKTKRYIAVSTSLIFLGAIIFIMTSVVMASNNSARQKPNPRGYASIFLNRIEEQIKTIPEEKWRNASSCDGDNPVFTSGEVNQLLGLIEEKINQKLIVFLHLKVG